LIEDRGGGIDEAAKAKADRAQFGLDQTQARR